MRQARVTAVALQGKRIFITGGAGFIATTLSRTLVEDERGRRARQPPPRRALGDRPRRPPELHFHQADVLDADAVDELSAGATHIVHCAAIAGVDTVLESPVRTMRVNLIGTYNVLEAAVETKGTLERLDRLLDERGLRHARVQREGGPRLDDRLGRRGALDVRRLEARRRAPRARLLRRARHPDRDRAAVQRLRAGADRRRRDPRVHRGGAPRRQPHRARRRRADPRLVLRRRHGRVRAPLPRASERGRAELQRRQPAQRGHDLRPRTARQAPHRLSRARSSSRRSTTSTSSCGSRTSRRRARTSASTRRSSSTTASRGRSRGIAPGSRR